MIAGDIEIPTPVSERPSVSVIIPVLNDAKNLQICLQHIARQTYVSGSVEILVVDNGSSDSIAEVKSDFPNVIWLFEPQRSSYAARNKAILHAQGEVLAFTDSDCLPQDDWIANGVNQLTRQGAADIIVGNIEHVYPNSEPESLLEWYQYIFGFNQEGFVQKYQFGATANLMVLKKTFDAVGMFEGYFESGGDQYWGQTAARAGYSFRYAPEVCVGHPTRHSYKAYFARARRHARGLMSIDYKNRRSKRTILARSLHPLIPRVASLKKIVRRRGKLPLIKIPAVFMLNWLINVIRGTERLRVSLQNLLRAFKARTLSTLRRRLLFPRLWAILSRSRLPVWTITGNESGLARPESITFSPSGDTLGVCNSESYSVNLYSELSQHKGKYASAPEKVISNAAHLNYVHDAVLSSCGNFLVTVAREAETVAVFFPFRSDNSAAVSEPVYTIRGSHSLLNHPTSVAVHPSGQCIAVTNRQVQGLTLYRQLDEIGQFEPTPVQQISEDQFYEYDLTSPCSLDFSPDGKFLIVAHKRYERKGRFWRGQSGLSLFNYLQQTEPAINPMPALIRHYGIEELHSVCIHPSDYLIAVTIEGDRVEILRYSQDLRKMTLVAAIPVFKIGSGLKGVGFTKDGKQLAVTTELNEVLFFSFPVNILRTESAA